MSGKSLHIVRAYPITYLQIVSTIPFPFNPEALFIEGNNMAVFGTATYNSGEVYTYISIYNIYNRATPQLTQRYEFQGRYFEGRKNGATGYVYLLSVQ